MKKLSIIIILLMYSCNTNNCSNKLGFKLDYHLFEDIKIGDKYYCDLVNEAMEGKKEDIIILSTIDISDFASYQHGAVLIEVIDKISEQEYLKIINKLSEEQKRQIYYSYIWGGLEFTPNPKYENKHIEDAFPELTKQLK